MHFKSLSDLHRCNNYPEPEHPLLTLFTCNPLRSVTSYEVTTDFYIIALKKLSSGEIRYGKTRYDHQSGSMYFLKPQQVIHMKDISLEGKGFEIWFHEDYLSGHPLHMEIKKYSYFNYELNEALHISPKEQKIIWDLYEKIAIEYHNNQDEFSRDIILGHIESILKYSLRFYKRQFINRFMLSGTTVTKFNKALANYFEQGLLQKKGLPTAAMFADELHLSPRYLSDLLKQETGKTAMDLIQNFLVTEAKNLLNQGDLTINEIANLLGYENPPYFSRLFKKETGISPSLFRGQHLN
ncbi:helix-turn-helix domain-containing protein [Mucilaginibacter paludis]|uniref:Transcriptional regulator, AraC family n=1 Tax=Mucilaginibacter paludis DSM 18603 TaxID=714943 RepID=H1Y686_9SPHI|nr:response regulator transcription factor [Mucilaginibacter paludis]EHQ24834.1 transcriptional regulator, AraC family [Mucilaginibacter paludis DSM 18603]